MAENLGKRPSKGILKTSSSFDNQEAPSRATKETKWDEMNIIATLHPADKDYGHMKIEEPKTPYNFEGVQHEDDHLDSSAVASKLAKNTKPKIFEESSEEEEDEETPEEKEKRKAFEAKRKCHYREWEAVQLARKKLLEEDEDEDEDEDISNEREQEEAETEKEDKSEGLMESNNKQEDRNHETQNKKNCNAKFKQTGASHKNGCCACVKKKFKK
ncbi:protein phosphatase inhibitor 2-like [Phymastichus coffea]|uniref:protein phosphatase inhibitor 2-like n=1 Tax=Phymastichus coffea TaxID=108790 RepID=UPI00273ABEB5|nr:protein phosphatase inhibitor 2-like [Phymastichus coffea]